MVRHQGGQRTAQAGRPAEHGAEGALSFPPGQVLFVEGRTVHMACTAASLAMTNCSWWSAPTTRGHGAASR
jgi:hypothetical protein